MNKVYAYIADSNPLLAKQIIEHFGYRVVSKQNMADNLQRLVAEEGEEALKVIMSNHPDKEIILEMFSVTPEPVECEACKNRSVIEKFTNVNGSSNQDNSKAKSVENNFSVLFLAGITILAIAIIKK